MPAPTTVQLRWAWNPSRKANAPIGRQFVLRTQYISQAGQGRDPAALKNVVSAPAGRTGLGPLLESSNPPRAAVAVQPPGPLQFAGRRGRAAPPECDNTRSANHDDTNFTCGIAAPVQSLTVTIIGTLRSGLLRPGRSSAGTPRRAPRRQVASSLR